MAYVNFKKGLLTNLPANHNAGTFYVTTDERAMYLDIDDSTRIRLGDFQEFETIDALRANANPSTTALYYVTGANCLAKWNGTDYIQINLDTGATSVEVTGEGNAVTGAVYNASTRKITFTKGATYETVANVDIKIANAVGDLTYNGTTYDTVVDFVNAKTSGIATDAALGDLQNRVTKAEGDIDALEELVGDEAVSAQIDNKIDALKLSEAYDAKGTADTALEEAKAYADSKDTAIASAQTAADNAQADVDDLVEKVGPVADGKTVVQMIAEAQEAATYNDEELVERVSVVETKVDTLVGADSGKSVRTIANEELAKQLIPENAVESLNTLEEIATWIQEHPDDASAMNVAIAALEAKVDTGDKTVTAYVTDAINALSIGDYAKAADLTALAARVEVLEGKAHTHDNKDELDKIVDGDVAKWNSAEQNAKDYADSVVGSAKSELEAEIATETARATAAEAQVLTDAKAYTDTTVSASVAEAKSELEAKVTAEVDRATAAEAQALADAKAYIDELLASALTIVDF